MKFSAKTDKNFHKSHLTSKIFHISNILINKKKKNCAFFNKLKEFILIKLKDLVRDF